MSINNRRNKVYKSDVGNEEVTPSSTEVQEAPFIFPQGEGECGIPHITITFDTLVKLDIQKNSGDNTSWYKNLNIDRSDASKIRRGLMVPPLDLRLKISRYFDTDSVVIWRREDMDEIRKLLLQQKRRGR